MDNKTVTFDAPPMPCPFCGSTKIAVANLAGWEVWCEACGASCRATDPHTQEGWTTSGKAIAAWNTRAPTSAAQSAGQEAVAEVRDNPDDIGTIIEPLGEHPLPVGTKLYAASVNGGERANQYQCDCEPGQCLDNIGHQCRASRVSPVERAADAPQVGANIRGEVAYQLHTRNRWLDMPTMRAIVDSAFDAAIAKNTLTSPAKVGGDEREAFKTWKRTVPPCHAEELVFLRQGFSAGWELGRVALSADGGDTPKLASYFAYVRKAYRNGNRDMYTFLE